MYKIGVIGDRESVLGFKAIGLDVFPCSRSEDAEKVLHRLAKEGYAIIYITEVLASEMIEEKSLRSQARLWWHQAWKMQICSM